MPTIKPSIGSYGKYLSDISPANQLIGRLSHHLQGFSTNPSGYVARFLNHQQYGKKKWNTPTANMVRKQESKPTLEVGESGIS